MFSPQADFNDTAVFKHNDENVVFRKNKDGSVLITQLNSDNKFYKITGAAAELWSKLDGARPLSDIIGDLLNEYEVAPEKLYEDSETCLTELIKLDFIKKV